MITPARRSRYTTLWLITATLGFVVTPVTAHITIEDPNGGEQFGVGSVVTVSWRITIGHTLLNWDLAYSNVDPGCGAGQRSCMGVGPWTTIASNLPPGSPAVGSIHTYDWTIPNDINGTVWVRVIMDNAGTDYTDFNDLPFSIISTDCNNNGVPDNEDIANGTSPDCNGNGIPDECSDLEEDCNGNGAPDECDIDDGTSPDCNANGIPDECIRLEDDCNSNNTPDACDISDGTSPDVNTNGIPDECECLADLDGSGDVGTADLLLLLASWGPSPGHPADLDGNGIVGTSDLLALLASWGPCP